jgi:hypothetical protein
MRIVKGGMVLRSVAPNQYVVKDESAVGIQISQLPVRLTKDALFQILTLNKIPFNRNDKKNSLEAQLYKMYALHTKPNSKHIIYEKGKARLRPKIDNDISESNFLKRREEMNKVKPKPRVRKPSASISLDEPPIKPPRPARVPPPLPPRPNKVLNLDEPPIKPPRPARVPPPLPPRPFEM